MLPATGRGMPLRRRLSRLQSRAWHIAGVYAALATAWIYYSDRALSAVIPDPAQFVAWSVYKGFAFVAVTSILLLILIRRTFSSIERHAGEVDRLTRLYAALSHVNQAIVRTPARDELFQKVCRVLVEDGQFKMAWVGLKDAVSERILVVASWGDTTGYLTDLDLYADDRPGGQGPSGRAFRSGKPYICNDIVSDPAIAPWRDDATRRGYRAWAVFPIEAGGAVAGLLNVYADEPGVFLHREVSLLTEAATDISFALDNLSSDEARKEAQAIARREQTFSDTMIDSMPGILYFYNADGHFLRWNTNFETVSGYSAAEIARMHPRDFFTADVQPTLEARIAEVFTKGESFIEAPFRSKDGSTIPYLLTGRRVMFEGQMCLLGMGVDLSERTEAEDARRRTEERFRSTLDNLLEGGQLIGRDWRYLYLNPAAAIHNRRPNEEMLGRTMMECWPGIEGSDVFALMRRCMDERRALHEETPFVFPDGSVGWFDVRCQPVPEGIFVLSIDISERREAELALRHINEDLEVKVAERTDELRAALVRAEAADRLKSAFLATMSHELRTPLNSIIGFTGILLQELAGPLNSEQAKQLAMVRSSARHLLDLINDVLDLSKIEAGQLEMREESFDLRAVIEHATRVVGPQAEVKDLRISVVVSPAVSTMVGDRRRVEQILLNLLSNGIKFTQVGGLTLTAEVEGDRVSLRVLDTGIGIAPADLASLFQPFRQIDSGLTRQHDGTGLGLAICRRLTTLMGGEISARSEVGRGSEFCVTLPVSIGKEPDGQNSVAD